MRRVLRAVGKEAVCFGEVQRLDVGELDGSLRIMLRCRWKHDGVGVSVAVCGRPVVVLLLLLLLLLLLQLLHGGSGVETGFIQEG